MKKIKGGLNNMKNNMNVYGEVFLEMTNKVHGGLGWELGKCLWSPEKSIDNRDTWKTMRDLQVDDLVIHSVKTIKGHKIIGISKVKNTCRVVNVQPPIADKWAGYGTYYRVELKEYKEIENPIYLQEFLDAEANLLSQYKKSFYTKDLKPAQKYITHLDPVIAAALIKYLGI